MDWSQQVILITGGTGSFGNAVLDRVLKLPLREIRIFSRDEKKQEDMRIAMNHPKLKFYIGDVRDYRSVHESLHGVDYLFHAAALKQVPSCEFYPLEALRTNVEGAENVMAAAVADFRPIAAADGKIKVRIAHVLPLSKAAEAHRMMEADQGMGKIVLDPAAG